MKNSFIISSPEEYDRAYSQSITDSKTFWADIASNFIWHSPPKTIVSGGFERANVKWFEDGRLNITENCIDRNATANPRATALIWEPNDPADAPRIFNYKELLEEVCTFANVLRNLGVTKGDRVCIYMPNIPELAFAVLACARMGAVHSVVFGGFSAQSIADRITDAGCSFVITANSGYRGAKEIPLKSIIDDAVAQTSGVQHVLVIAHSKAAVKMKEGRDLFYHSEKEKLGAGAGFFEPVIMNAEDSLFILYTSGSTGKPKGVVHTCGGYMVWAAYTFQNVFQYKKNEVHFCTADIGWITGHSYVLYGPLAVGATTVMFEGIPTWPDASRFWQIIEKYKVNIFYTAPTAIRSLMAFDVALTQESDLSSLRVLGTVGEPINEEAWHWYNENIGKKNCPIVDTWWQTETGGVMISNLAGITKSKPSFAALPLPGIAPVLLDENGHEIEGNDVTGNLAIKYPWPGMIRTTYGDHERCIKNYFSAYPGYYFTGDGALRDETGLYRITGRVDDVLNVSGHRIGTAEIENVINLHPAVIESAVVGAPHAVKGEGIFAFVILAPGATQSEGLGAELNALLVKHIGAIARAEKFVFVPGLPKTRSGKIMRRILRKIAAGEIENLGDITTLLDPAVVDAIIAECK